MDEIKEHYKKIAKEDGASKQSTMKDVNIRDLEVDKIINTLNVVMKYFSDPRILEIGCGNGYTSEEIYKRLNVNSMVCIDYCDDLINIAKKRKTKNVTYEIGDVLALKFDDSSFDIVFTERCLINLVNLEKQKMALEEIRRILKKGGIYIMVESFVESLENLNLARKEVGIEQIPQPFHNLYFEKRKLFELIKGKFEEISHTEEELKDCNNFLSTYYFASRVLYPALIAGKREMQYNTKFVEFFKHLPPYGDYGYIKMFVFKKL